MVICEEVLSICCFIRNGLKLNHLPRIYLIVGLYCEAPWNQLVQLRRDVNHLGLDSISDKTGTEKVFFCCNIFFSCPHPGFPTWSGFTFRRLPFTFILSPRIFLRYSSGFTSFALRDLFTYLISCLLCYLYSSNSNFFFFFIPSQNRVFILYLLNWFLFLDFFLSPVKSFSL